MVGITRSKVIIFSKHLFLPASQHWDRLGPGYRSLTTNTIPYAHLLLCFRLWTNPFTSSIPTVPHPVVVVVQNECFADQWSTHSLPWIATDESGSINPPFWNNNFIYAWWSWSWHAIDRSQVPHTHFGPVSLSHPLLRSSPDNPCGGISPAQHQATCELAEKWSNMCCMSTPHL